MTISLERLLKHMAWANQRTIEHIQTLPPSSLRAYSKNPDWFVAEMLHHIFDSADDYHQRITGLNVLERPNGISIAEIEEPSDLMRLKEQAWLIDNALLNSAQLEDIEVEFKNYSGNVVKSWRSTMLSQAIHHATEHRTQIAAALDSQDLPPLDLDQLDLWSFERESG